MRGHPVENLPESVRLFVLCESMKWAHLPVAGGLYDQHPRLLDEWEVIFRERAEYEKQKQAEEQRKSGRGQGAQRRPTRRGASRSR